MLEGSVQIHGVVMSSPVFPDVKQPSSAQVSNDAPYRSSGATHCCGDLLDGAVGVDGYIHENRTVT